MKSRETLIRLRKFQVDEKRRKVAQIEAMVAEFERMATDLDREIQAEQDRAGIHDPAHFAYPTYAKAALGEAFEELKKVELLDERDQVRERAAENAREQAELDHIGMARARANVGV